MHKSIQTGTSELVQSKGRSQFIVHSRYKQAPAVPLTPKLYLGGTPSPFEILTSAGFLPCIRKDIAFGLLDACVCQLPGFGPLPVVSSRAPQAPATHPHPHRAAAAASTTQEGTSRHHRAQATFCCRGWLTCLNDITAYLFLLFSVYLLCFPVHKLFFTSFLKELLFNSIAGINYCITSSRGPLDR